MLADDRVSQKKEKDVELMTGERIGGINMLYFRLLIDDYHVHIWNKSIADIEFSFQITD